MTGDALIYLRVPAAVKGRWVRASRAAGMRLTDWIAKAVEAQVEAQMSQQLTRIVIPSDVRFADLKLARERDGHVSFDWRPVERVCAASGIDVSLLRETDEDNVAGLLVAWYTAARANGEPEDATAEDLASEVRAEERIGQHVSLPPGRA